MTTPYPFLLLNATQVLGHNRLPVAADLLYAGDMTDALPVLGCWTRQRDADNWQEEGGGQLIGSTAKPALADHGDTRFALAVRAAQRAVSADDGQAIIDDIVALAKQCGRYSYRRVTALLHAAG